MYKEIREIYQNLPVDRYPHILRVTNYAIKIAKKLKFNKKDLKIVIISCFLHDVGYKKQFENKDHSNHHIYSLKLADKKLRKTNLSKEEIKKIKQSIKTHGEYEKCKTKYQKVLYDADKLDKTSFTEVIRRALIYDDKGDYNDVEIFEKIKSRMKNNKFHFKFSKKLAKYNRKDLLKAIEKQNKINEMSKVTEEKIINSLESIFN